VRVIAFGVLVTLVAWVVLWLIGEACARLIFGARYASIATATRLPLGLAATICFLETAGYFLSIGIAAWFLIAPAAYGAVLIRRGFHLSRDSLRRVVVAGSLLALAVGLMPLAIAGRFTAAALTNNDGSYYITAADYLANVPWRVNYGEVIPDHLCLVEGMLHGWNWRTGTPNLMATVSALAGIGSPEALAVVTALLFACVPPAVIGIVHNLGVATRGARGLLVGVIAACSAAPAFVGYQHMTGHLAACSMFPLGCAALLGAVRLGGIRRYMHAALYFGAGIGAFADGSTVLVLIAVAALAANVRRLPRALLRLTLAGAVTGLVVPFTFYRAAWAAKGTLYRASRPSEVLFPQRGWLSRSALDDLATLTGVDPWPPWPGVWPPNTQTLLVWVAGIAGAILLGFGARKLRTGLGEHRVAALISGTVLLAVSLLEVRYLSGKVLLMGAAFALPLAAAGAVTGLDRPRMRFLVPLFMLGELLALGQLLLPSRWKVVDRPAHDALVPALASLPVGSLIAFDGLGAPADQVLDAQRAHRAALLAQLKPVQPGLDGGFYRPRACATATRPNPMPAVGYALQRTSSENLTRGKQLAAWDGFRLLEVDLGNPNGFIAVWAPTHGFMAAEREPSGRVFRWAEWQAKGTLQAIASAPCARLKGELRVVNATAAVAIKVADDLVYSGQLAAEWTGFATRPFDISEPRVVSFAITQATAAPPDQSHAVALSNLSIEPLWRCGTVFRLGSAQQPATLPIEFETGVELSVDPPAAARCSEISVLVVGERGATFRLSIDGGPPGWHYLDSPPITTAVAPIIESARTRRLSLSRAGGSPEQRWQLLDVVLMPRNCPK
jgi:hypothetical protein